MARSFFISVPSFQFYYKTSVLKFQTVVLTQMASSFLSIFAHMANGFRELSSLSRFKVSRFPGEKNLPWARYRATSKSIRIPLTKSLSISLSQRETLNTPL
jgi:hypothetical protein